MINILSSAVCLNPLHWYSLFNIYRKFLFTKNDKNRQMPAELQLDEKCEKT